MRKILRRQQGPWKLVSFYGSLSHGELNPTNLAYSRHQLAWLKFSTFNCLGEYASSPGNMADCCAEPIISLLGLPMPRTGSGYLMRLDSFVDSDAIVYLLTSLFTSLLIYFHELHYSYPSLRKAHSISSPEVVKGDQTWL